MQKIGRDELEEIIVMRAMGASYEDIAKQLDCTAAAISHHMKKIRVKAKDMGYKEAFLEYMIYYFMRSVFLNR